MVEGRHLDKLLAVAQVRISWDADLPPLFLRVLEPEIKHWVASFFRTGAGNTLRVLPPELSISAPTTPQAIELQLVRQANLKTGAVRVAVAPRSAEDVRRMREWVGRHEAFTVADFVRHRRLSAVRAEIGS